MKKNKLFFFPLIFALNSILSFATDEGITYTTTNHSRQTDPAFGGDVLKIGYGGPCSATVEKNATWNEDSNVLVGCCPDTVPTVLTIYGTANTKKNVYTSGKTRSGNCIIDGGTWNCGGMLYLGSVLEGSLEVKNGGQFNVGDTLRVSFGSTVSVKDNSSKITLTLDNSGNFGEFGGINVYVSETGKENSITFEDASNLAINATNYSKDSDEIILENFITAGKGKIPLGTTLTELKLSVGGKVFTADNQDELNRYLSGITVLGFEDYTKSFIVDSKKQSVSLCLSKIPEPSAFGLLAGLSALMLVATRRKRK